MKFLHGFTNVVLFLIGIIQLGFGTYATLTSQPGAAAAALTMGLVFLMASNIERFEFLKALGMEAKTRQLDTKIDQADKALTSLRQMTELTCAALIDLQSKIGRWNSTPAPMQLMSFANNVRNTMEGLGSDKATIHRVLEPWAKNLCFDIANEYYRQLYNLLFEKLNLLTMERDRIPRPINPDHIRFNQLTERINTIEAFLEKTRYTYSKFNLDDYHVKFLDIFNNVPEVDEQKLKDIVESASKFIPGMKSLAEDRKLVDSHIWINQISQKIS